MKRVKFHELIVDEVIIYDFKCPCCKRFVRSEDDPSDFMNEKGIKEDDAEIYICPKCDEYFIIIDG